MTPVKLLWMHRYEEALAAYDAKLRTRKKVDSLDLAGRASVLFCLGRFEEALPDLRQANELACKALHGETAPYLEDIGVAHWLMGNRTEAIKTFKAAVDGILDGSIKFADLAGGVGQGLLLWYAGVTTKDAAVIGYARKYLNKLSKASRIRYWPGPMAIFVLGRISFNGLLEALIKNARGEVDG